MKKAKIIKRDDPRARSAVPLQGSDRVPDHFIAEGSPVELRPLVDAERRVWWEARTRIALHCDRPRVEPVGVTAQSATMALSQLAALIAFKLGRG